MIPIPAIIFNQIAITQIVSDPRQALGDTSRV
jgi:hypothetical protein